MVLANAIPARTWNRKVDEAKEKGSTWKRDGVWFRLAWPSLHRAEAPEEKPADGDEKANPA